jgi:hypothetical protein
MNDMWRKNKTRIDIIKTDEISYGFRKYTPESIRNFINGLKKEDATVPVVYTDRYKDKKPLTFLKFYDFEFDAARGVLSVWILNDALLAIKNKSLIPYSVILASKQIKPPPQTKLKEHVIVNDFAIAEVVATEDLCAFNSIDSKVK